MGNQDNAKPDSTILPPSRLSADWFISNDDIIRTRTNVGSGAFAKACLAKLRPPTEEVPNRLWHSVAGFGDSVEGLDVVMKIPHTSTDREKLVTNRDKLQNGLFRADLCRELHLMIKMGPHAHIVKLFGYTADPTSLVLEYCSTGCLLDYLTNKSGRSRLPSFSVCAKNAFCCDRADFATPEFP